MSELLYLITILSKSSQLNKVSCLKLNTPESFEMKYLLIVYIKVLVFLSKLYVVKTK